MTETHYYGGGPIRRFIGRLFLPVFLLVYGMGFPLLQSEAVMADPFAYWTGLPPLLAYAAALWCAAGVAIHAAQPERMIAAFEWAARWLVLGGALSYAVGMLNKQPHMDAFAVMLLGGTFTLVVRHMRGLKSKADGFV